MKGKRAFEGETRNSRFPPSLFFVYLVTLFLMSGIHIGLLVGMDQLRWSGAVQTAIAMLYWAAVATGLTLFTRSQVQRVYEEPMLKLAEATRKVAAGDFSVYVAPLHTIEEMDYLDKMIVDFNTMVEELGSIETLKTDFLSNVSHEIKTPLAVIQSNAELLRLEGLTEKQREHADAIYWSSGRLADLIGNILKLNKLENQAIAPVAETYDLCEQLAECAAAHEPVWEKRGLDFEASMEDRAEISADPALMELVWNNLLSNAVKFTEPGGRIVLTQRSEGGAIRVSVQDSGCGMTEEIRRHIFEKFYQGDPSHSTTGNGLGLALAWRVLQLNDFGIEVESEPGKGSTFTVVIPKADEEISSGHE